MAHPSEILAHRERANLSQAELSRRLGVSRSTVCKWENGQRQPGRRYWPLLAKAIGVPITALIPEALEAMRASEAAQ